MRILLVLVIFSLCSLPEGLWAGKVNPLQRPSPPGATQPRQAKPLDRQRLATRTGVALGLLPQEDGKFRPVLHLRRIATDEEEPEDHSALLLFLRAKEGSVPRHVVPLSETIMVVPSAVFTVPSREIVWPGHGEPVLLNPPGGRPLDVREALPETLSGELVARILAKVGHTFGLGVERPAETGKGARLGQRWSDSGTPVTAQYAMVLRHMSVQGARKSWVLDLTTPDLRRLDTRTVVETGSMLKKEQDYLDALRGWLYQERPLGPDGRALELP
jgi:hypothetical protein